MKRSGILLALILGLVSGGGDSLAAQSTTTAELAGRVISPVGHPLQSVQVAAVDLRTGAVQMVLTGAEGYFRLPGLRPGGPYRIEVRGLGYPTERREPVFVALGGTERITFTLARPDPPGSGAERVSSLRVPGFDDRGPAGASKVITEREIHDAPIMAGDPGELVRLSPWVSAGLPGSGDLAANHRQVDLQVDGLAAPGAPFDRAPLVPAEAIQELRVGLASFDVRRNAVAGLSVEAVTRSGTNDPVLAASWSGSGREDAPGRLAGSAAGPLIRDRAHVFVAAEWLNGTADDPAELELERRRSLVARIDLQIDSRHRTLLQHARGNSRSGSGAWRTSSTVAQLNSNFGDGLFNELRIGARSSTAIPDFDTWRNEVRQQSLRIANDLSVTRGRHHLTLGTSNDFRVQSDRGARVQAGAERIELAVRRWSFYLQDRWDARPDLMVSLGARVDLTQFPHSPRTHPVFTRFTPDANTGEAPENAIQLSPRIGIVWEPSALPTTRLRGGVGIFSGLTPLRALWQSWTPLGSIEPDYRHPAVFRLSGGVDRAFAPGNLSASVEATVSRTLRDLRYRNPFLEPDPTAEPREGRSQYRLRTVDDTPPPSPLRDALTLSNTTRGQEWSVALRVTRPETDGWGFDAAWVVSDASDLLPDPNLLARDAWLRTPVPGDPADPPVGPRHGRVGHRIIANPRVELPLWGEEPIRFSLVFVAETGRPYSFVYSGDVNGDGAALNDLIRVPTAPDDVRFADSPNRSASESVAELEDFIDRTDCLRTARGEILARGTCTTASHRRLDVRITRAVGVTEAHQAELILDLSNVGNLLSDGWGRREYVPHGSVPLLAVSDAGDIDEAGRVLLAPFTAPGSVATIARSASTWQIRLGLRFEF